MSFLDSAQDAAEDEGPPAPQGGQPAGPQGNPMQGGGPVLASIANRQRGPRPSAPGPGDMASSMTTLQQAIGLMNQALPGLMQNTPVYQDTLKALQRLSKHVPQGAPAAGVQKTQLEDLLRNLVKNVILSKIMGQQRQQGQGPGVAAPAGAQAQAPMPSTPLPGA